MNTEVSKQTVSRAEAANMLGISQRTAWSLIVRGELKAFQTNGISGRWRVPVAAIDEFIARRCQQSRERFYGVQKVLTPEAIPDIMPK